MTRGTRMKTERDASPEPLLIDVARAAEVVGVSVGVIRGWVSEGLPFVRAGRGGRKMFTRRDLERFIEGLKEQAQQPRYPSHFRDTETDTSRCERKLRAPQSPARDGAKPVTLFRHFGSN